MDCSMGRSTILQNQLAHGRPPWGSGMRGIRSRGQHALRSLQQQPHCQRSRCLVATSASSGSASSDASSLLKLSIPFATEFGDSVAVTTSTSGWSVEQAVPLTWGEGDVWHGELQAQSGPLEYKYVIRRGAEVSEWQPGENLVVDVPSEPAVLYIEDRWLNEERSVQMQQAASSGMQAPKPSGSEAVQPAPTATDKAEKATAAASASSPAAAVQQPTAAEPESEDAAVAAQRGNSLGKPLAKHTVKELKDLLKAAMLPVTGKKQELIDRLIEAGY